MGEKRPCCCLLARLVPMWKDTIVLFTSLALCPPLISQIQSGLCSGYLKPQWALNLSVCYFRVSVILEAFCQAVVPIGTTLQLHRCLPLKDLNHAFKQIYFFFFCSPHFLKTISITILVGSGCLAVVCLLPMLCLSYSLLVIRSV